jgi:DNA processing protein
MSECREHIGTYRLLEQQVPDDVLVARAFLSRVAEPATHSLWRFVEEAGPVAAAAAVRAGSAPAAVLSACAARCADADPIADLDIAARHDMRLVVPESADWPHLAMGALHRLAVADVRAIAGAVDSAGVLVPPLALWVRGNAELSSLGLSSVAIVGARAATEYGRRIAAVLSYDLATAGLGIVSGGAFGIDAAAHRGALTAGGATILVSAGGIDQPYPRANAGLFDEAAEHGLVLSESPPGSAPQRHRFLTRNRIIAALSRGVVVVEAAHRSGAANTAAHAAALGRTLMAVPGPVTSPMSAGCHALIRRQSAEATLVTCAADVLELVGPIGITGQCGPAETSGASGTAGLAATGVSERSGAGVRAILDALPEPERRVFDGLPARAAARPDEIAARCGVEAAQVIRALPGLVLSGLVEEVDGRFRISRRPSQGPP